MTNILDARPDAQAYAFSYRFQIGHALRATNTSELRIECEPRVEDLRLFLDGGDLFAGVEAAADIALDANVTFRPEHIRSGEVHVLPKVEWRSAAIGGAARPERLPGLRTVSIPAGTELDVDGALRIRFPREAQIELVAGQSAQRMNGLRPVLFGGLPLLEVDLARRASAFIDLSRPKTAILTLFGVVSPYRRRGTAALVHVMEAVGDRVIGGSSVQLRI